MNKREYEAAVTAYCRRPGTRTSRLLDAAARGACDEELLDICNEHARMFGIRETDMRNERETFTVIRKILAGTLTTGTQAETMRLDRMAEELIKATEGSDADEE